MAAVRPPIGSAGRGGRDGARYPVLLDLAGRACLVVGGGAVAFRKVRGLLAAGAAVTVIAPTLDPRLTDLVDGAHPSTLAWRSTAVGPDDDPIGAGDWAFVVAATDDAARNRAVVAHATARGIWANDASDPTGGPAAVPAIHRDGPLTVAVSTDGAHPGAAAWARDRAADAIGAELAVALRLVDELRTDHPGTGRVDWRAAVESGMLEAIRQGREAEAKERLLGCLSSSSD